MIIDTIEQYLDYATTTAPIYVVGKKGRRVPIPCANTILVARHLVQANTYNPNHVSDDKMELLFQSIVDNGYAFPIIVIFDNEAGAFVVIDGFHRYLVSGPDWLGMPHVPIAILDHGPAQRMVATWQFNKARGVHEVDLDADLIRALIQQGMEEEEIATHLGIDLDTVHRYKQVTGIAALFSGARYSMAWEIQEVD